MEVYRAFEVDAQENRDWIDENGKSKVPAMALSGEKSAHKIEALEMFNELHKHGNFEVAVVEEAGHYIAEENPDGFTREVLNFVGDYLSTFIS